MYETIYELSPEKIYFPLTTIMCFFMGIGLLINGIDQFKKLKAINKGILKKAFHIFWITLGIVGFAFFIPTGIFSITYGGSDNAYYAEIYGNGEYNVVEGIVKNYYDDGKLKKFDVADVSFRVGCSQHRLFKTLKVEGEVVRVCYINTDISNRILKLEVLHE